jgi:hypothetical protein
MMEVGRIEEQGVVGTPFPGIEGPTVRLESNEEMFRDPLVPPRLDVTAVAAAAMAKGLAKGIVVVCGVLEIPLDEDRLALIERLDVESLEALLDVLADDRRWP